MVTHKQKMEDFERRSARLLRLQVVASVALIMMLFLVMEYPEVELAYYGILIAFVLSSAANGANLFGSEERPKVRAAVSYLLLTTWMLIVASIAFAIQTIGGN